MIAVSYCRRSRPWTYGKNHFRAYPKRSPRGSAPESRGNIGEKEAGQNFKAKQDNQDSLQNLGNENSTQYDAQFVVDAVGPILDGKTAVEGKLPQKARVGEEFFARACV